MKSSKWQLALVAPVLIVGSALVACGGSDDEAPSPAEGVTAVERQLLESRAPDRAPGQDLELTRVIIPAGQSIAAHTHPGLQMAVISEGTLTYSVLQGEVKATRASGTTGAKTEMVGAGKSTELKPGDSITETPGMTHTARNAGKTPVVIYLSSLFPTGAAPSSPAN